MTVINVFSTDPGSVLRLDSTTVPSAGCAQCFYFSPGHTPCRCSGSVPLPAVSLVVPPWPLAPYLPGQLCGVSRHVALAEMEGVLAAMEEQVGTEEQDGKEEQVGTKELDSREEPAGIVEGTGEVEMADRTQACLPPERADGGKLPPHGFQAPQMSSLHVHAAQGQPEVCLLQAETPRPDAAVWGGQCLAPASLCPFSYPS